MRRIQRNYSFICLSARFLFVLGCLVFSIRAQTADQAIANLPPSLTSDEAAIAAVLLRGYEAYAKKDAPSLFAFFSQQSPYLPAFQQTMQEEFAANANADIGVNIRLVHDLQFEGDKANVRVYAQLRAVDKVTGKPADGFGDMDHTFHFVKENGMWKIWQFLGTAEELVPALLAARNDQERAVLLKANEPFTDGLLRGLADQAQNLLEAKGDETQATMLLNLLLGMSQKADSEFGIANALVGLGDVYLAQGDYLRAADNYEQVMKLAEKLDSEKGIAAMSVKLGNIHYYQGNFTQAMEYYQKSAKLYERQGSTLEIAYPLLSIGNAYFAQNRYTLALEYYQRSLKIYEQIFDKSGTAYLLTRIGEVYAAQQRSPEAVRFYQRSLQLYDELGNKSLTAISLNAIGNVRYREGNYIEAAALSSRATELAREGNAPEVLWKTLTALGRAKLRLKETAQAEQAYVGAIAVLEKLRGQLVGNERDQQQFFENKTEPYVEMVESLIAQGKLAEAFHYAELAKGRTLLDVLRNGRADITRSMTDGEQRQEKQLNAAVTSLGSQLRKESSLPHPDKARLTGIDARLQTARLEYEAYETRIYAAHPELKIKRGSAEPITLPEVASLIRDEHTALLEYVVAPEKTYLFVLTRNGAVVDPDSIDIKVYPISIGLAELNSRVQALRKQVANNSLDFKEQSRQLRELLLSPAQKELKGKTTVCIVPAEGLWELPFQALLSSEGRYLLEDAAVVYAPSLSVLREMRKKDVQRKSGGSAPGPLEKISGTRSAPKLSLLAMGNPSLSERQVTRAKSTHRDFSLGELPEAEQEVKTLRGIYGVRHSKILTGAAAQEQAVKAEAWRYPILHFATHGLLDDQNPLYSRLLLASANENDDGFLEAREIMKLDLHADLAVLSACQTARGTVSPGEGLIGMSWAFFIAGASTTVVSQWKVDSASTARLMVSFHRALQGMDKPAPVGKAEALRRAALKLMSNPKYHHPFYWSGFVVVGNGM